MLCVRLPKNSCNYFIGQCRKKIKVCNKMFLEKKLNYLFGSVCKFIERQNIELRCVFKIFLEESLSAVIPTVIWGRMSHIWEYSANLFWTSSRSVRMDGDRKHFHISPEVFDWICQGSGWSVEDIQTSQTQANPFCVFRSFASLEGESSESPLFVILLLTECP